MMLMVQRLCWHDQFLFFFQRPSLPKTVKGTSHHYDCDSFRGPRSPLYSFIGLNYSLLGATFSFVTLGKDLKEISSRTSKPLVTFLPLAHWYSPRDRNRWSFGKVEVESSDYQLWQSSFQWVLKTCFPPSNLYRQVFYLHSYAWAMAIQFHRHVVSALLPQIPWKVCVLVTREFNP